MYAVGGLKRICGRFDSFPGDMDIYNKSGRLYIYIYIYISVVTTYIYI